MKSKKTKNKIMNKMNMMRMRMVVGRIRMMMFDEDYQDDDDDDDEGGTKGVKKNVKKVKQVKKVKKVKKGIATKVEGKGKGKSKRKEDTEMVDGAKVKGKGKVDQHYRTEDRHREHSKVYHQTFKKSLAQGMSPEEARADARLAASMHVRIMFG
jgi:hypothetical protein